MADFDEQQGDDLLQGDVQQPPLDRMTFLEQNFHNVVNELHYLRTQIARPPPPQPRPNLNLPQPPPFSGVPSELPTFKLKLFQFLIGNHNTYTEPESQLLFAGSLLSGSAGQWYHSLVDPNTLKLPPHYTLDIFFQELEDFFGGGITLQSRERSLDILRQTGTVSELAIAFQNITSTFSPRWADHPLIYTFSKKLRESIRFELTARGSIPDIFHAYLAAAISVEQNQAAAALSRSQPSSQPPRLPFLPPKLPALPSPPARQPDPNPSHPIPMEVDGTRGRHGPLTMEERRRRSDAGLCAYCAQPGHTLVTCPSAARVRQARGTYLNFPSLPLPPAGSLGYSPAGYPLPAFQGPYPGPWTSLPPPTFPPPSPHTQFIQPPSPLPKNDSPSQ